MVRIIWHGTCTGRRERVELCSFIASAAACLSSHQLPPEGKDLPCA